jgi:RNA polymerase sigma factor (sigma-70 family)
MREEMNKQNDTGITPELLERARAKDKEALSRLYEKTQLDIYRTVHAMIRDEDLTLDIQQDTYLKAFSRLDQLRDAASFLPWLRQIAVNEARAQLTKKRPMAFSELSDGDEEDTLLPELPDLWTDASPEMTLDRKETNRLIREILSGLSDGQRMLLGMFYYERLPLRRIAEDTGLSEGTIKAQLHRGRKRVETEVKKLEAQGIKLYGLSPVAFLLALMRRAEPTVAESARQAAVKAVVAKASADAVAVTAVPVAAKTFGQVLTGRLLAGALAVALIGGGIWGGAKLLKSQQRDNPYRPTTVETNERLSGVETPEEISETNEDLPVITDPAVTEPVVTEPAETQPAATEPAVTEPSGTDPAVTEPSGSESTKPVRADNQCGEHLTWSFDPETGWLTIAGSGPMDDYADVTDTPWYSICSEIQQVELPDNLTSIGDYAFAGCTALEYCFNDSGLQRIGDHAFDGCTSCHCPMKFENCEIGNYAFRGCPSYWSVLVCSETVTRIGEGAFAGCGNLEEIWILNRDCAVDATPADPSVTLCGFPDSPAAQYAEQSVCPFHPFVENRNEIVNQLEQGIDLRFDGIVPRDSRYLMKVVRADRVTATEAELQQAAQTGTIVLSGREYPYADSAEEAAEWGNWFTNPECDRWTGVNSDEVVGWVRRTENQFYKVLQQDDYYIFYHCSSVGEWDPYLNEFTDVGWLWLDADNPFSMLGDIRTMDEANGFCYKFDPQVSGLGLNDQGQIVPGWHSAGK